MPRVLFDVSAISDVGLATSQKVLAFTDSDIYSNNKSARFSDRPQVATQVVVFAEIATVTPDAKVFVKHVGHYSQGQCLREAVDSYGASQGDCEQASSTVLKCRHLQHNSDCV